VLIELLAEHGSDMLYGWLCITLKLLVLSVTHVHLYKIMNPKFTKNIS